MSEAVSVNVPQIETVRGFAKLIKASPFSIYRAVEAGTIPAYRLGTAIRIDVAAALGALRVQAEK